MPDMTGFEVIDELAAHPECPDTRIFVLTARDLTEEERRTLEERVAAVTRKGQISREQFLARIKALCNS
jgi:CheY-like chemotaxis protein